MFFFKVREKSGNFENSQGNLKNKQKSGNFVREECWSNSRKQNMLRLRQFIPIFCVVSLLLFIYLFL